MRISYSAITGLLVVLAASFAPSARAADEHVRASLVAGEQSIQAGRPFTVALRLEHEAKWHTYWLNPGTGLPTGLKWQLPKGFTASEIRWPAPHIIRTAGEVTGSGYDGDTLLPITITPPATLAAGSRVTLSAKASWLMCADVCIPGGADLSIDLVVTAGVPAADPTWGPKIEAVVAGLPSTDAIWTVSATRNSKSVRITVTPLPGSLVKTADDIHFFAEASFVAYAEKQTTRSDGNGGYVLTVPIDKDATAPARLKGVLTSESGWLSGRFLRGLQIDAPLALTADSTADGPLAGTLLLALVGGLILNLMPCVFPVLGIKVLGFVNQAGESRSRVATHGLTFTAGVLVSFWTLAGFLAVFRAGGAQIGWGFQLQSPAFVFALAALLLVFAMNLSGVFEFGLRATAVGSSLHSKSGYAGTFFSGVLATIVATPCSAPFLAPALGAALALPMGPSFAVFTAVGIGLSTPYLVLSAFPGAVKILPRPGAWMETFKQAMAFPLYASAGYLVWVLAGQVAEEGLLSCIIGLVLVAMGAWAYGRWSPPGASAGRLRFAVGAMLVLASLGLWLGWPRTGTDPSDIVWDKWSPEAVAKLRSEGRIVYVDFTARWCATCQANKKLVFHSEDVLRAFRDKKIATLRGDWTNNDPAITAELAKYERSAVPFNVIWMPGKDDPVILPELLTASVVLGAVGAP